MEGTFHKAPLAKKIWLYYMMDALVKDRSEAFLPLFEEGILANFQKDIKEAFLKEQHQLAKKLLILFLSWEGYFDSNTLHKVIDKLYSESGI